MKLTLCISALVLTLIFGSCKKSDPTSTPTPTQTTFTLTVNNGEGAGTYSIGDTAYVFSNPASNTQVFDKWTGDVSALKSPNEWRTTLKMPASNVNVTATYKTTAAINFTNIAINGSQVFYYVPATY